MVQPSSSDLTRRAAPAPRPPLLAIDPLAHDEVLLVAALERIEAMRLALEDLLSAGVSGLLYQ